MFETPRICPTCGTRYFGAEIDCPFDQTTLVPAEGPSKAAPPSSSFRSGKSILLGGGLIVATLLGLALLVHEARPYQVDVSFESGHGLQPGDRVYVLNTECGRVVRAGLTDGQFVATLQVNPDGAALLKANTIFHVTYDELFGAKMCVTTLTPSGPAFPLPRGSRVKGVDSALEWYYLLVKHQGPAVAVKWVKALASHGIDLLIDQTLGGPQE